ncbi:MAG: hypothetical protein U0Q12_04410 [Vicinamibacterales bacterium]
MTAVTSSEAARRTVLTSFGASSPVSDELLAYGTSLATAPTGAVPSLPLADEPHLERWTIYAADARDVGAFEALKRRFVQLQFPIREGLSSAEEYRLATRQGRFEYAAAYEPGLELRRPDRVTLDLSPSMAGRIPVVVAEDRHDFEALVQAFTTRNEPTPVPPSMGACIVTGLNNWDRVAWHREQWEAAQPDSAAAGGWAEEFKRLAARKELYQDRFIILSRGPYSNVGAADVGETQEAWLDHSLAVRREHEFAHYFTYRLFGAMRTHVFDEVLADFVALHRAYGRYRPELAKRFLGLESFPPYRVGGRLGSYRGEPPVSDEAFLVLQRMVVAAIGNVDRAASEPWTPGLDTLTGLAAFSASLCHLTFDEMASADMVVHLRAHHARLAA